MDSSNARILKIQRFCINDGPGIRTTVFFKSCPLQCQWCHNPEARKEVYQLSFNKTYCTYCGNCMEVCPENAHIVFNSIHEIDFERCRLSGECIIACPSAALSIIGETMDLKSMMRVIMRDMDYYTESGGGVTASGGEPMMQPEFVYHLFSECRKAGISTCLDTCGYAAKDEMAKILSVTDHILYDMKIMDEARHIRYTGKENGPILENFLLLMSMEKQVTVRHVVIPGINDTEKEHKSLSLFLKDAGFRGLMELIPYHSFGKVKYKAIGMEYQMEHVKVPEAKEMEIVKSFFKTEGFSVTIN